MRRIIIYGNDTFFIKNKTKQLLLEAGVEAFNISRYDLDETSLDEALNDALTVPFLEGLKAVVCLNARFLSDLKFKPVVTNSHMYQAMLDSTLDSTIIIFQVPGASLIKQKWIEPLINLSETIESPSKKPEDLKAWVDRQLSKASIQMNREAYQMLIDRITHDPEVAYNEIKKLLIYAADQKIIDEQTIDELITFKLDDNVYNIINLLMAHQKKDAYLKIEALLNAKEDPLRILTMMIQKFREILVTQTMIEKGYDQNKLAQSMNVKSGRAFYMMKNARAFSKIRTIEALKKLETYDYQIKTGHIDKKLALELFIFGH